MTVSPHDIPTMTSSNDLPCEQDVPQTRPNAVVNSEEPDPAVDTARTASPASSRTSGVPGLTRTDSSRSDQLSMTSHTSIPVVGTFPLGSLRVHKAIGSPRPPPPAGPPAPDTADMPPLEGEEEDQQMVATTAGPLTGGGDIFLLLDLPPNSTVGCDARAIGIGTSHFQGLRDIPPGPHLVWVSEPSAMSRCGYWFLATAQHPHVHVKQWDRFNEVLVTPPSAFEVRDLRDNVSSLYPQLVPYGLAGPAAAPPPHHDAAELRGEKKAEEHHDDDDATLRLWRRLAACISTRVLARVTGKAAAHEWLVDTSDSAAGSGGFLPTAAANPKTTQTYQTLVGTGELTFLFPEGDVDVHTAAAAAAAKTTTGVRTDPVPDTSMDIVRLLDTPGTGVTDADLVGELQLAFLTGLHLSNLACIEHWWHLVLHLVLRAHQLVVLRPSLSLAFLTTLHSQMVYNERYISPPPTEHRAAEEEQDDCDTDHPELRREYGGGGATTSWLDVIPGNKRKLREALTLYKRRMNELLLSPSGGRVTAVQGDVGKAFGEVETWFWKLGWDLRTDYVQGRKGGAAEKEEEEEERGEADDFLGYEEEDEYRPVIVDLDSQGREVGLVSFR